MCDLRAHCLYEFNNAQLEKFSEAGAGTPSAVPHGTAVPNVRVSDRTVRHLISTGYHSARVWHAQYCYAFHRQPRKVTYLLPIFSSRAAPRRALTLSMFSASSQHILVEILERQRELGAG